MPRLLAFALVLASAPAHADPHLTFEANLGTGGVPAIYGRWLSWSWDNVAAHPLAFGAGAFVLPEVAITLRYAQAGFVQGESGDNGSASFIGASAQCWLAPPFWVGAGVGFMYDDPDTTTERFQRGFAPALDLRAGAALVNTTRFALNVSLEYTPGFYLDEGVSILGLLALAVGVQLR